MTQYHSYGVTMSDNQEAKLARAFKDKSPTILRLSNDELQTQLKNIEKAMTSGESVDDRISKTNSSRCKERRPIATTTLVSLGTKVPPMTNNLTPKVVPGLATDALSGLGWYKNKSRRGGFLIPQNKIDQLITHRNLLIEKTERTDSISSLIW
ncbi:hypothetical protein pdam_00008358 [Pocillopora damicornis]|uniref:Uncharacterized protein n=1 Tax=Pocillopora damicornis TaxID=46731 RepID=A0A3M6U5R8_POCDA|nr:hypothetical protein pdam_00008358 [Pocillopora damicornis]